MKQRRFVFASVALMMCAVVLLSGTLLILHAEHECHQADCSICMALERREAWECILVVLAAVGLYCSLHGGCAALLENRFVPDWTPVQWKVKLLN